MCVCGVCVCCVHACVRAYVRVCMCVCVCVEICSYNKRAKHDTLTVIVLAIKIIGFKLKIVSAWVIW